MFRMERTYSVAGTDRLDWLLVKPAPQKGGAALFPPRNPKTLQRVNEVGRERLSNHNAIIVDLEVPRDRGPASAER